MTAYYNEIDPYAAQWLRNLIDAGHIAPGVVDTRSIEDVIPNELTGFTQCHFFAGIGVWSYALRRAGWPDDRPVWTGSCPCQPFSSAGQGGGFADERHLWPAFFHLIEQCRPPVVFGEQVASRDANPWIDLVQDDLEGLGYGVGAIPFPSASIGAPHIRDRLYWMANAKQHNCGHQADRPSNQHCKYSAAPVWLADTASRECIGVDPLLQWEKSRRVASDCLETSRRGPVNGFWAGADWLYCRDDRWRPVEPGTFPLATGASSRMGRLRAYGNAINAEAARVFIEACL